MDPVVAKERVSMMEKIFEFLKIEDVEKVNCAMYMLRNDARIWWDAVKKTRDMAAMIWVEFLVEFNSKYYNQAIINNKLVTEFTRLH